MTQVRCKRCEHSWDYKGAKTKWCTCPECKTSVRLAMFKHIEKTAIQKLESEIEYYANKFDDLHDFIKMKNPDLLVMWSDYLIEKSKEKAEEEIKEVLGDVDKT